MVRRTANGALVLQRELICCKRCGRDTRNKSGYCCQCGEAAPGRYSSPIEPVEPQTVGEMIHGNAYPKEDDYGEESGLIWQR